MSIHPTATIHKTAVVPESCEVEANAYIGPHCKLGENNRVMHGAWIGPHTTAGDENTFYPYSTVGGDPQFLGFDPATPSGTVIGNKNHFREYSTVHRGLKEGGTTIIGNSNYIMAYGHVAHDCHMGNDIVIVNYSGISGHTIVEDRVFISGQSSCHQFCRIGTLAMVGGQSGVVKDLPPYMTLKHYGIVIGLNVVGLRRAGIPADTRMALRHAYKEMFRSGRPLTRSIEILRDEWQGREMPKELAHLLDFCSVKSKRGISRGPHAGPASTRIENQEAFEADGDDA